MIRRSITTLVLKWAGTVLVVLTTFAFIFSTRRGVLWNSPNLRHQLGLMLGTIGYGWRPEGWRPENEQCPGISGWGVGPYGWPTPLSWWIVTGGNRSWQSVSIPLWMPFILLVIPTAVLWYRDRANSHRTFRRFLIWLAPEHPKSITVWCLLLFCGVHLAALFLVLFTAQLIHDFFVEFRSNDPFYAVTDCLVPILFWMTPLSAVVWAWAWTRFVNKLYARQPAPRCRNCGYDLTGNVSGTCPECGKIDSQRSRKRPADGPRTDPIEQR